MCDNRTQNPLKSYSNQPCNSFITKAMPGEIFIVLFGLFGVALSAGPASEASTRGGDLVSYHYENTGDGNYNFA